MRASSSVVVRGWQWSDTFCDWQLHVARNGVMVCMMVAWSLIMQPAIYYCLATNMRPREEEARKQDGAESSYNFLVIIIIM
jgi:hypothetical protein